MKNQTACFTGHRKIPFFQKRRLKAKVKSAITDAIRNGYRYFGAGGALGFDMLAAQTVLELKADYPDIKLILVLPCFNQTRGWAQEDVKEYERIKAAADKVTYIYRKSITTVVCTKETVILLITARFVSAILPSNQEEPHIP